MHIRPADMSDIDALNRIALNAKAHWGYSADQLRAPLRATCSEPDRNFCCSQARLKFLLQVVRWQNA
jgi:hypothetical protein